MTIVPEEYIDDGLENIKSKISDYKDVRFFTPQICEINVVVDNSYSRESIFAFLE